MNGQSLGIQKGINLDKWSKYLENEKHPIISKNERTYYYFYTTRSAGQKGCVNRQQFSNSSNNNQPLVNQSEQSRKIQAGLRLVYAVHEGYLTLVNRFCSIVTEARLALPKVQMYSAVLHKDRG